MHIVQGQSQTVLTSVWEGWPQTTVNTWRPLNSLSLSTQCTLHIVHCMSYIVQCTSYIVQRCIVPWTLWVSVIKWSATDYTDQAEAIWVYVIAQPPELSESQYTVYITHCTLHVVHRTSHVVHRTSLHDPLNSMSFSDKMASHRLYWPG